MASAAPRPAPRRRAAAPAKAPPKRARRAPAPPPRAHRRLAVVYDIDAPHVRLGMAWFLLVLVALAFGTYVLAVVYAATAALAGYQAARCWRQRRPNRPDPLLAAGTAAILPLAAAVSTGALGLAILVAVGLTVVRSGVDLRSAIPNASRTLQCGLWVGGAAAAMVCTHRYEPFAAVALLLAASAYETGDYLVGSGARNAWEGPLAGAVAVFVVQFAVSAVGLPPFEVDNGLLFAVIAAVLCPLGQLFGSLVLPTAAAPASAVRRLDSLLLLAPIWAVAAGALAAAQV
jgi:hypothetical protein